jgi:hypothetical protein
MIPLSAVAAISWRNVWAVGYVRGEQPRDVILHWNGRNWKRVPTPDAGPGGLASVAAVSSRNAWTVGGDDSLGHPFIEHWNGTNWRGASSPGLGGTSGVGSVAASSASNVWAVGSYDNATNDFTFAVHCG